MKLIVCPLLDEVNLFWNKMEKKEKRNKEEEFMHRKYKKIMVDAALVSIEQKKTG